MGRRTAAVATNLKGHHFASFVRADGRPRIFEYDFQRSPSIINEFGRELNGEVHTLRIDKDDNIWAVVTDTNSFRKLEGLQTLGEFGCFRLDRVVLALLEV
jgi:hypothetical protein